MSEEIEIVDAVVVEPAPQAAGHSHELATRSILRDDGLPRHENTFQAAKFAEVVEEVDRQLPYASPELKLLLSEIWYVGPVFADLFEDPKDNIDQLATWHEEPLSRYYSGDEDPIDILVESTDLTREEITDDILGNDIKAEFERQMVKDYVELGLKGIAGLLSQDRILEFSEIKGTILNAGLVRAHYARLSEQAKQISYVRVARNAARPAAAILQGFGIQPKRVRLFIPGGLEDLKGQDIGSKTYYDLPGGSFIYEEGRAANFASDSDLAVQNADTLTAQDLRSAIQVGEQIVLSSELEAMVGGFIDKVEHLLADQGDDLASGERANKVVEQIAVDTDTLQPVVIKALSSELQQIVELLDQHYRLTEASTAMPNTIKQMLRQNMFNEVACFFAEKSDEIRQVLRVSESLGEVATALAQVLEHTDYEQVSTANLFSLKRDLDKISSIAKGNEVTHALYDRFVDHLKSKGYDASLWLKKPLAVTEDSRYPSRHIKKEPKSIYVDSERVVMQGALDELTEFIKQELPGVKVVMQFNQTAGPGKGSITPEFEEA